jgi:8-oxo-dGTP pyrophosphatase MutT (NUDIX family)
LFNFKKPFKGFEWLFFMIYKELTIRLLERMQSELPGKSAQFEMASYHRLETPITIPPDARSSGVTIVIYPIQAHWHFTLIQRPFYDGPHGGQVAFPGGKCEPSDRNLQETAVRETFEEIGVVLHPEHLIGQLTELYIPVSNTKVQAFIAILESRPAFKLEPKEVAEILECKVLDLLKQNNKSITEVIINKNLRIKTPYFSFHNKTVWGATAMILNEFKKIWEDSIV